MISSRINFKLLLFFIIINNVYFSILVDYVCCHNNNNSLHTNFVIITCTHTLQYIITGIQLFTSIITLNYSNCYQQITVVMIITVV